jgi:hypothetical protein
MSIIVGAVVGCSSFMLWLVSSHPDARTGKTTRKNPFRGELGEAFAKQ